MSDQEQNQAQATQEQSGQMQTGQELNQPVVLTPEELKKRKRRNIIAAGIILLVIVAVIIWFLTRPKGITEGNYKQIMDEMEDQVQEGYFETYMNTEWIFPDGASETTNAVLGNSPNNVKPIRCEVILEDTEEVVFKTDVIPVGAELPPFKLDVDLDAGTYNAVCMIYLMDEQRDGTYTDYSNAGFNVTITVQN